MSTSIRRFFYCSLFFPIFSVPLNANAGSPEQFIERQFIQRVSTGWRSFELCEYRSINDDRIAYFAKALDFKRVPGVKVSGNKEFTLRENSGDRGVHLGIVELEFPTQQFAGRVNSPVSANMHQFFSGRKILTRYVSLQKDRRVIIVYSETYNDPTVGKFLDQINELGDQVWSSNSREE